MPKCEAEVVAEAGESECCVRTGDFFFGCCGISEAEGGVAAGVLRSHTGGDVVFSPHGEVCVQLGFNFTIDLRTADEISDALDKGHDRSP